MPDFDFDSIGETTEFEWPKRGRKARPLPQPLITALHNSYSQGTTPYLDMPVDKVKSFGYVLNKAGEKLNYRIEREIQRDFPEPGMARFHFRVKNLRNKEEAV